MKTILFLNSPLFSDQSDANKEDYLPPLGLGIVASALINTHKVIFHDLIAENYGAIMTIREIGVIKPDYVCINIFTTNYAIVKSIVESDKTDHKWIIGGLSTKAFYQDIFAWGTTNHIDVVCGDGEKIIRDLVDDIVSEDPVEQLGNRRFYLVNELSSYYVHDLNDELLYRVLFVNEPYLNVYDEFEVSIYASRGCPHNCAFCGAARSRNTGMGIRRKSCDKIGLELEHIKQTNGNISCIRVLDDLFLINESSMMDAARIFSRFKFKWRAMCHIKSIANVDNKTLKELKESGCKELFIGIESGSPRILRKLHKTDDLEIIMKALIKLFDVGIDVKGYFVCGIPTETEEDLHHTLKLATDLKSISESKHAKFRITCFKFRPYCGTELYDEIISVANMGKYDILYNTMQSGDQPGKKVFSFDSGNYSDVSDEFLSACIKSINEI